MCIIESATYPKRPIFSFQLCLLRESSELKNVPKRGKSPKVCVFVPEIINFTIQNADFLISNVNVDFKYFRSTKNKLVF